MTRSRYDKIKKSIHDLEKQKINIIKKRAQCDLDLDRVQTSLKKRQKELVDYKEAPLEITEHAKLRYLERISGIPMDTLEEAILPKEIEEELREKGDGKFKVNDHIIVVASGRVVTVHEHDPKRPWKMTNQ